MIWSSSWADRCFSLKRCTALKSVLPDASDESLRLTELPEGNVTSHCLFWILCSKGGFSHQCCWHVTF